MLDLLLPRTDTGVIVQLVSLAVATAAALAVSWRHSEWRLLIIGAAVFLLGIMGVRAIH